MVNRKQKKGIRVKDLNIGSGRVAEPGTFAVIKYQGFLNRGDKVASSDDQPGGEYRFQVGRRDPTVMLESSVVGMREGGTREARISPHLAYREGTSDGRIPPNALIRWVIELVRVEDGQVTT
ncbi:MAG TPA: FKBP-type peptidyl-prolyl cis-trans isomerase [Candidatus Polarisedimenticolaceae bacterium]|nr:FKBP-type peptidyl-prolyl cis-trans isomerase [Candidatus Polarisedimenticolaceae bacterium]